MVDLNELEEVQCPTCQRPFVLTPVPGKPNTYVFDGCRCNQQEFYLPEVVGSVGIEGGQMFLVRRKRSR